MSFIRSCISRSVFLLGAGVALQQALDAEG